MSDKKKEGGFVIALRWITFLAISGAIGFFSWNLFYGMGFDDFHKNLLGGAAIIIEGLKILALISANTFLFLASVMKEKHIRLYLDGFFKKKKLSQISDEKIFLQIVRYHSYMRNAVLAFVFYGVCSFVTLTSSFGFILESVDSGTSLVKVAEVSVDSQISNVQDQVKSRKDTVQANKDTIENNKLAIADYRAQIVVLDKTLETYTKDKAKLDKTIKSLLQADTDLTAQNTALLQANTDDLTKVQTTSQAVKAEKKAEKKDMYTLMEEAVGIPASKIRFTLLSFMSLIMEIGLFFTSPHMYKIPEDEKKEEALHHETDLETTDPEPRPCKKAGRPLGSKNRPKNPLPKTSFDALGDADPVPPVEAEDAQEEQEEASEANPETPVNGPVAEQETQGPSEVVLPLSEVSTSRVELNSEKLINELWDNDGHQWLSDLAVASKNSEVPMIEANHIFEWLQNTKYEKYPLIEFRTTTNRWYPNVTSEIAKKIAREA